MHLMGKKFQPKPPPPDHKGYMSMDFGSGWGASHIIWPMQVIDGPYEDELEEEDRYVVRYSDGHVAFLSEGQILGMKEVEPK
jgi:hypothetical protein